MPTLKDIAIHRLKAQQLAGTHSTTPQELVAHFGAMQAQDFSMARWAVGVRLGCNEAPVTEALDGGHILRTHVLRPTWHLLAAEDIRWMLALTAPNIQRITAGRHRELELDGKLLTKAKNIITKALEGGRHQTREVLMNLLEVQGIATNDNRSSHILMDAELEGLICSGPVQGKVTYALLDDRAPATPPLAREEALAQLALRYFTSHGPATVPDFAWWSGLSQRDCTAGLNAVQDQLEQECIEGQTYWWATLPSLKHTIPKVLFLPAYDEFLISYKDRSALLTHELASKRVISSNGIFRPTIVVNGCVVGWWQRSLQKGTVQVTAHFFDRPKSLTDAMLRTALKTYSNFLGMKADLIVAQD